MRLPHEVLEALSRQSVQAAVEVPHDVLVAGGLLLLEPDLDPLVVVLDLQPIDAIHVVGQASPALTALGCS